MVFSPFLMPLALLRFPISHMIITGPTPSLPKVANRYLRHFPGSIDHLDSSIWNISHLTLHCHHGFQTLMDMTFQISSKLPRLENMTVILQGKLVGLNHVEAKENLLHYSRGAKAIQEICNSGIKVEMIVWEGLEYLPIADPSSSAPNNSTLALLLKLLEKGSPATHLFCGSKWEGTRHNNFVLIGCAGVEAGAGTACTGEGESEDSRQVKDYSTYLEFPLVLFLAHPLPGIH